MDNISSLEYGLIDRLTEQVGGDRNLALNILRKRGHVYPDSEELTPLGQARDQMGAIGRAFDRAGSQGLNMANGVYDLKSNKIRRVR
jgi:hypothetical protein